MSINENDLSGKEADALAAHFLAEADEIEAKAAAEAAEDTEDTGEIALPAEDPKTESQEVIPEAEELFNVQTEEPVRVQAGAAGEGFLPFTVSVADSDGLCVTVLEKGTRLPAAVKMIFSAPYKTPSAVKIRLYMGEGIFAKDNIEIGRVKLSGIREYKGGITRIVMTLRMEANGDIEADFLDEGSVSKKHEKIELDIGECRTALEGRSETLTDKDIELRDNYLVLQRARYVKNTAGKILKANRKETDKETADRIRGKIKELGRAIKTTDPMNVSPAQRTALKNMVNELSSMF